MEEVLEVFAKPDSQYIKEFDHPSSTWKLSEAYFISKISRVEELQPPKKTPKQL